VSPGPEIATVITSGVGGGGVVVGRVGGSEPHATNTETARGIEMKRTDILLSLWGDGHMTNEIVVEGQRRRTAGQAVGLSVMFDS